MIYSLIITSSIWLGYEIINLLSPPAWDQITVLAGAIPFGFGISSWIYYFIQSFHSLNQFIGFFVSILYIIVSYYIHINNRKPVRIRKFATQTIFLFSMLFIMYIMLVSQTFLKNGTGSSATSYSDLPFHLSLISSFAYGYNSGTWKKQTPFYAGANLCYPIIADYFSSILVSCGGSSLRVSLAVPTILLLISITISIYDLSRQFSKLPNVAELSVVFFLLASGTGWRYFFVKECRSNINTNYVHAFCNNKYTFWIHSLIHFLMPQRSGIFSTSLSILITSLLVHLVEDMSNARKTALLAGVLMGIIPMMSAHTYIGVGEYAIFICILTFPYKQVRKWREAIITWCFFGIPAIAISLPQIVWLMREKRSNFFIFKAIHKETDSSKFGFFKVWWSSLGAFAFLSLISVWIFNSRWQNLMYLPSIGVFIVSNLIRYQPGAMDNTKVFLVSWYPLACAAVSNFIVILWKSTTLKMQDDFFYPKRKSALVKKFNFVNNFLVKLAICGVVVGFCFGSVLCIYKAIAYSFPMFNNNEKDVGIWMIENTNRKAVVLAGAWGQNPAMSLGGRLVTLGYLGWVWTHGLDMNTRIKEQKNMNIQKENIEMFKPLNILYAMSHIDDASKDLKWNPPGNYSIWMPVINITTVVIYRRLNNVVKPL